MSNCIVFEKNGRPQTLAFKRSQLRVRGYNLIRDLIQGGKAANKVDYQIQRYYLKDAEILSNGDIIIPLQERSGHPRFTNRSFNWFVLWLRQQVKETKVGFRAYITDVDDNNTRYEEWIDLSRTGPVELTTM